MNCLAVRSGLDLSGYFVCPTPDLPRFEGSVHMPVHFALQLII